MILGIAVFEESFRGGAAHLPVALAGLAIAVAGVVSVASSGLHEAEAKPG